MSSAWSWFVITLVVLNVAGILWLLLATRKSNDVDDDGSMGHTWDGIEELNNPLPRWWFWLFILTIVYSVAYLWVYPGMGNYSGTFGWTQINQYEQAKAENTEKQNRFFSKFSGFSISELAADADAMQTAKRLFLNNCATCHGSGAQGAKGFPDLTDNDWLYGSQSETIIQTIKGGRAGVMPNLNLSGSDVAILSRYVKHLSGDEAATEYVLDRAESKFAICESCHGKGGVGNQALGAPNLADDIWLHGGNIRDIEAIVANGLQSDMPSFEQLLSDNEIRLLAAYVLSLNTSAQ